MPEIEDHSQRHQLGTPADIRAAQPVEQPAPAQETLDPHKVDESEWRERRHGIAGLWDAIAYRVQLILLSVYGAGEQTREADPIERLKRKYGRAQREH